MRTEKLNPQSGVWNLESGISAAADEMDDFDFVGIFDANGFPIFFPHDRLVEFNGDALTRQRKFYEQFDQIRFVGDFFGLAVNKNFHNS